MSDPKASDLHTYIENSLIEHRRWESSDFVRAQCFLWLGILASIVASLNATGVIPRPHWLAEDSAKLFSAIVAAIPAAVIVIDKTFKWSARSSWHALFGIRLRAVLRGMDHRGLDITKASEEVDRIELDMHNTFPALDGSALVKE